MIENEANYSRRGNQRKIFKNTGLEFNRILNNPAKLIPALNEVISNAEFQDALRRYFGAWFEPTTVQAWRNYHMPIEYAAKDLLSNHWHQDSFKASTVKIFMALHETGLAHGPFHFLSRSYSQAAIRAASQPRIDADVPPGLSLDCVNRLTGPKGSMLLINTMHCMHKAGIPAEDCHRDIIEMRFAVSSNPPTAMSFPI